MEKHRRVMIVVGLIILTWAAVAAAVGIDCTTVTALLSACTQFVTYGSPDPAPGSPCCNAVVALQSLADITAESRQFVCRCLMGIISSNKFIATPIATLPGFCGISLGFTIDPTTNCE